MHHHLPRVRVAGLVAILAALVLAPAAPAASPSKASDHASAKERAYGKHCGPKAKDRRRSVARTKCLDAMAKLDKGSSGSPSKACRGLSRKRASGERKSAFARCVSEGARLQAGKNDDQAGADDGDGAGDSGGDPGLDEAKPDDDDDDHDGDLDEGDAGDVDTHGDGSTAGDDDDH